MENRFFNFYFSNQDISVHFPSIQIHILIENMLMEGPVSQNFYLGLMPILHYALGLRFGKVCEQNASKTRAKREQNVTDSCFCPTHSKI